MHRLRAFFIRIFTLLCRRRTDDDFLVELESHIAMHTEDGIRDGLSLEEACRQALIMIGGAEQARQAVRDRYVVPWFENLLRDMRYALRRFCRAPIFAVTAVATLTLGIGAATAVFSVVDLILFRPLPYAHAARIVSVGLVQSLERDEFTMGSFYFDWLDHQRPFAAMASQGTMVHSCDLVENNPVQPCAKACA